MKNSNSLGGTSSHKGFEVFDSGGIVIKAAQFEEKIGDKIFRTREVLRARIWKENKTTWTAIFLIIILTVLSFFLVGCLSPNNVFLSVSLDLIGIFFVICLVVALLDMIATIMGTTFRLIELQLCPGCHIRFDCKKCDEELFEWHACEHKLIHVLGDRQEVTVQTIMEASSYDNNCGCGEGESQKSRLKEPSIEKILETVSAGQKYLALAGSGN